MAAETCIIANAHTGKPVLHKVVTETITVAIRKAAGAANGCRIQGIREIILPGRTLGATPPKENLTDRK